MQGETVSCCRLVTLVSDSSPCRFLLHRIIGVAVRDFWHCRLGNVDGVSQDYCARLAEMQQVRTRQPLEDTGPSAATLAS